VSARFGIDKAAAGSLFVTLTFGIMVGSVIFGPVVDRAGYRVLRGGEIVDLTPKLLDLLLYLLDRPATLVTKDELPEGVWPDANVTENARAQAMGAMTSTAFPSVSHRPLKTARAAQP
jgi:hypothetical protein